jgi:hypothetical protein
LALAFHRKSFDTFNNIVSFFILAATFGLIIETLSIPVFKLLKLPVKLHLAVFYTFAIVIILGIILVYNKTHPVIAKVVFINGNGKTELCAEGNCLKFKPSYADIFDFRKPTVLRLNNTTYQVERGIYILNLDGGARVVLYRLKEFRRISKTKVVAEVEEENLGVYRGFAKVWENPQTEVYLNEKPPRERLMRFKEALSVFFGD